MSSIGLHRKDSEESGDHYGISQSYWLGVSVLASLTLLSIIFTGADSFMYGVGITLGRLFTSFGLAFPIFILVKYATQYGKRLSLIASSNFLAVLVAAVWLMQLILILILPSIIERITHKEMPIREDPAHSSGSARKCTTLPTPSLQEFLEAARPKNPTISDALLTEYWLKTYSKRWELDLRSCLDK